ncbi:hypothetical protein ACFY2Q_00265 [Micromonospora sp. NPDC000316]|uniref:hypothetical protein n=1 Tax=Micromonospora sp. NPDC000316 TaxID=3364216 RepID=UPI0036C96DE1
MLGAKDAGEESSRTTMRVFAEDGQVYIKELSVRVADDLKLGAADLLQVDLDLLMQAFAAKRPAAAAAAAVSAESAEATRPYRVSTPSRTAKSDRAYRRMPDPSELKDIYLKNRTVTGVAKHYGVPTHTAQGWITRLRRKGVIPSVK